MSCPLPSPIALFFLLVAACGGGDRVTYGDGQGCTANLIFGAVVSVKDATSGAAVTGATLTLIEGAYTEQLRESGSGLYLGAEERVGVYQLEVVAGGYQTAYRSDLMVAAEPCHVIPVTLEILLQPQ